MSKLKISIVTVVYNDVKHIEKSILNTLAQSYDNIEYIVVDGASTDGTLDVIKKYADNITWKSEPDKGIYDAMTKGAEMATGDWIMFHNCGDYFYHPDAIAKVFSRPIDEEIGIVTCINRAFSGNHYKDLYPRYPQLSYYDLCPFFHQSTFVRADLQKKYGFDQRFRNSADYDLFVRLLKDNVKYEFIPEILTLSDFSCGATAEHYDVSLKDNIKILYKNDAPSSKILKLKYRFIKYNLKKLIQMGKEKEEERFSDWEYCDIAVH